MRKLFTFLFAALMSVGMFALTPLSGDTWDNATKTLTVNSNPGTNAYANKDEIEHVIINNGVTSIGDGAFLYCIGLASITIPSSVTSIGQGAFQNCQGLTSIEIPNSVTSIGQAAFYGCTGLTSVTIGNSVESIGADAFYSCTNITDVYCYPNAANLTWDEDGKDDFKADGSTVCHVHADQLSAYQSKFTGTVNVTFVGDLPAPEPEPEPQGVTVVFEANGKKKEVPVASLPHTFSCSYENRDGELDAIIKELYEISAGHCSDDNYPVASGNEAVLAGSNGFDNYITISAAFEGTATVSGWYWNSDTYDGDGDWMDYTLTISIKGDEPEPQGETITVTWNSYDLPSYGTSFTKDGVTLTCTIDDTDLYGPGTFTTDLGNFTQIVVSGYEACYIDATGGWSGNINQKTWTGNAASVSWGGDIYCYSSDVTFVFTIEPKSTPTAIENSNLKSEIINHKLIKDGMLLIEQNGVMYNVLGARVK